MSEISKLTVGVDVDASAIYKKLDTIRRAVVAAMEVLEFDGLDMPANDDDDEEK